jgi:hypothetical protein
MARAKPARLFMPPDLTGELLQVIHQAHQFSVPVHELSNRSFVLTGVLS